MRLISLRTLGLLGLVAALTVAGAAAAAGYAFLGTKRYDATAHLIVSPVSPTDPTYFGLGLLRDTSGKRTAAASAAVLLRSPQVADAVRTQLGLSESRDTLLSKVRARVVGASDVVAVTVRDTSAVRAAQLANAFAGALVSQRTASFQSQLATAIRRTQEQLLALPPNRRTIGAGAALQQRLTTLQSLQGQPDPTLRPADQAEAPASAAWPNRPFVIGVGAGLGLVVGGLIALVVLLLREWLNHAWRSLGRPLGTNANDAANVAFTPRYSRTPRTPLWLMLALTLSGIAVLLHPEVRQALEKLRSAYSGAICRKSEDWSSLARLKTTSKLDRDPQLLALLALLSTSHEERLALSDEAIRKDPSLTWLDYEVSRRTWRDNDWRDAFPKDRVERLQKWDFQNSAPYIVAAESIAQPAELEQFDAVVQGKHIPDTVKRLANNPDLISAMHAAITAPKYDDYATQALELTRSVSARFSIHDPEIIEQVIKTNREPRFDLMQAYIQSVTERGDALEKSGNPKQALAGYHELFLFAQRVELNAKTPGEQYLARDIGESAGKKLVPLYTSLGRADEASMVSSQLDQWKILHDLRFFRDVPLRYRGSEFDALAWSGLLINIAGLSLLAILPLALISVLYVFSRRKAPLEQRGFTDDSASLFADAAPWLLLASSVLIYFTYHPYARICAEYLKGGPGAPDMQAFLSAMLVPYAVPENFGFLHDPVSQWSTLIAVLSILLVFFLWRMTLRRVKPIA